MRPVADHIRTLLYEHDYVTVPNFGAFIANYLPSSFNEISGSLMPPQKRIAFNEVLKQDDGLLATHISRRESVTIDDAKRIIRYFVTEVKDLLATEKNYTIDRVGSFILNEENNLVFEPDRKHNFYSESFGFDSLFPRHISSEKYSLTQNFNEESEDLALHQNSYSSTAIKKYSKWTYALYSIPILLLSGGLFIVLFAGPKSSNTSAKSSFNPLDYIPKQEEVIQKSISKQIADETEIVKPNFGSQPISNKVETNVIQPAPVETSVKVVEKVIEAKAESITNTSKSSNEFTAPTINNSLKRYLVVSGVFKSAENVEKLQVVLQKNGFSPKVVKVGDLSKVIAAEVSTMEEAKLLAERHIKIVGEKPAIIKGN